jgi:hypothetical protein
MAGISDFKGNLIGGGARPNLFKVFIGFPNIVGGNDELASFMIKGASLPASVIAPIEVPFRGRKLKIAGDRTFEPWTITVLNDTGMEIRRAFEKWMARINRNENNTSLYLQNNTLDYMVDMRVIQLDRSGEEDQGTHGYNIRGAFPTNISAIELNYETNDSIEEFTVELNYQYWETIDTLSI